MADNKKYVSDDNLLYVWQKIKLLLTSKADVSSLSNYALKSDITSMYRVKGSITWSQLIALTTAQIGDVYNVTDKGGANYVCIKANTAGESSWDKLGDTVDLSIYALIEDLGALAYKDSLSKSDVGLSNVDNTSDVNKPVSTATQNALNLKEDKANLKALAYKASLSKGDVGLGNVDNTSDLNKPISTATQNALNLKANNSALDNYVNKTSTEDIAGYKKFIEGLGLGSDGLHSGKYDSPFHLKGGNYIQPDLNELDEAGIYYCERGTNVPTFENFSEGYYTLIVFDSGSYSAQGSRGMVTQMLITQKEWWIRWKWADSSFNSWERFGEPEEIEELTNAEIDTIFNS